MSQTPIALSSIAAEQMMQQSETCYLVDIRSSMEFLFIGHPLGSIHIAWMDEPDWDINPNFVSEIRKLILGGANCISQGACARIILICRSGVRSLAAGKFLINAGFTNVSPVVSGFEGDLDEHNQRGNLNGWRHDGLAWEQC
jgi:rhodanese-related sulfurtransferase